MTDGLFEQTAVIKEALRLGYGVATPLARVVGPSTAQIGGMTVPKGVSRNHTFFLLLTVLS
jgi:hypothetical protein